MLLALKIITFEIELTQKLFRRKVIFIPKPIAPWRGVRLGLLLLIKNSKSIAPEHEIKHFENSI